jgi:methyl-accepting chemotaxis protein
MNRQVGGKKFAAAIARAGLPGAICAVACGAAAALWLWDVSSTGAIVCIAIGIVSCVLSILLPQIPAVTAAAKLGALERVATHSGETGDIRIPENIREAIRLHDNGDEISDVCKAMVAVLDSYMEKVLILEQVAQGDLSTRVRTAGESDTLGNAINDVLTNTSRVVSEVKQTTAQFSVGVRELANGAQSLAQSSSEQASTVDQLQISVGDIAAEAETNAAKAAEASKLTAAIRESASVGRKQVESMSIAMREIADANHSIGTVMRAIDEIAFQTNILALNAAVEAARAGSHGRGFAVVADEVRSLASKSGGAASESNAVILDTIAKSDDGLKVVEDVQAFFRKIEEGIITTSGLLDEIAVTAKNQSDSIDTINDFIVNLTNVVLLNNATSEQSAAASEEMSGRAVKLEEVVNRFRLAEDQAPAAAAALSGAPTPAAMAKPSGTSARPLDTSAKHAGTSARPLDTSAKPAGTSARPLDTSAKPLRTPARPSGTPGTSPAAGAASASAFAPTPAAGAAPASAFAPTPAAAPVPEPNAVPKPVLPAFEPSPLMGGHNPVNEPVPEAGGRTPAEIYAEALAKKTPVVPRAPIAPSVPSMPPGSAAEPSSAVVTPAPIAPSVSPRPAAEPSFTPVVPAPVVPRESTQGFKDDESKYW